MVALEAATAVLGVIGTGDALLVASMAGSLPDERRLMTVHGATGSRDKTE